MEREQYLKNFQKERDLNWYYLRTAISMDNVKEVLRLLKKGVQPNFKDYVGFNALHLAVYKGRYELILPLVEYGVDLEECDNMYGYKPFHVMVFGNNKIKCLEEFIKLEFPLDTTDHKMNSLLHLCAMHHEADYTMIQTLIDCGLHPDSINGNGDNCLHLVSKSKWTDYEATKIASLFIDNGAEINVQNYSFMFTPLHLATNSGKTGLVELLLNNGADINIEDYEGNNAFDYANKSSSIQLIQVFMKHIVLKRHRSEKINGTILKLINSDSLLKEQEIYFENQITALKLSKISENGDVTYYNILCSTTNTVVKYLRNEEIIECFNTQNLSSNTYMLELVMKFQKSLYTSLSQKKAYHDYQFLEHELPKKCVETIVIYSADLIIRKIWNSSQSVNAKELVNLHTYERGYL